MGHARNGSARAVWSGWRTAFGLAVAAAAIPFLLGNGSCLTTLRTPVGDPEHGWADPRVSGVWMDPGDGPKAELWVFEPYDPRTWLVRVVTLAPKQDGATEPATPDAVEPNAAGKQSPTLSVEPAGTPMSDDMRRVLERCAQGQMTVEGSPMLFKGWAVTLGGRRFLVLEPRPIVPRTERGPDVEDAWWWPIGMELAPDRLILKSIKSNEKLAKASTRSEAEAIISRSAADPAFYEGLGVLERVPVSSYDSLRRPRGPIAD